MIFRMFRRQIEGDAGQQCVKNIRVKESWLLHRATY